MIYAREKEKGNLEPDALPMSYRRLVGIKANKLSRFIRTGTHYQDLNFDVRYKGKKCDVIILNLVKKSFHP